MISGLVSNIQKYSVHDGPGIRTTVFLKGCPLRCGWCHNPENLSRRPQVVVFETRCIRCGQCVEACPTGEPVGAAELLELAGAGRAGSRNRESPALPGNYDVGGEGTRCRLCGACIEACPSGARQMTGREMSVAELVELLLEDRIFYEDSGGGVTFSGGEPLLQFEFVKAALAACRDRELHTAVDTCGYARQEHLLAIAPVTGLFLYDLKLIDDARHREHCGASNDLILANLAALSAVHSNIWLRVPVIPGVNDDDANLDACARLAAATPGVRQVNLLPYHRAGVHKHRWLHGGYVLEDVLPPSHEHMETVARRFQALGVNARIGGA